MTNAQQPPADAGTATPKQDPTLRARQLLAWVISFAVGGIGSAAGFYILPGIFGKPIIPLTARLPISFVEIPLLPLAALPAGLFVLIWVDYFMGTKILPD
jgi:hypothetical protein